MAGKTATINVTQFRADWDSHVPIAFLCVKYTITKDQVVRLRDHWQLPLRLDRRLRFKPKRPQPPTPEEIAASESSLALAPAIAARVTCVNQMWTDREWAERAVTKPKAFSLKRVELTDELRDDISEDEW